MSEESVWKQLQDKVSENQKRWEEIDSVYYQLKTGLDFGKYTEHEKPIIILLMLLTDQLRPMSTTGKETGKLMDDISGMMGKLGIKV
jgi:hypothetical protein